MKNRRTCGTIFLLPTLVTGGIKSGIPLLPDARSRMSGIPTTLLTRGADAHADRKSLTRGPVMLLAAEKADNAAAQIIWKGRAHFPPSPLV